MVPCGQLLKHPECLISNMASARKRHHTTTRGFSAATVIVARGRVDCTSTRRFVTIWLALKRITMLFLDFKAHGFPNTFLRQYQIRVALIHGD